MVHFHFSLMRFIVTKGIHLGGGGGVCENIYKKEVYLRR